MTGPTRVVRPRLLGAFRQRKGNFGVTHYAARPTMLPGGVRGLVLECDDINATYRE